MSEFIHRIRQEYEHEDARANEEYRAPMRDVYYQNGDGEQCKAPIVAESDGEALEVLTEVEPDATDVEIRPDDKTLEQLEAASSRLHSHLMRSADRRDHETLWHAFDTAPEFTVGDEVLVDGDVVEVESLDFNGDKWWYVVDDERVEIEDASAVDGDAEREKAWVEA